MAAMLVAALMHGEARRARDLEALRVATIAPSAGLARVATLGRDTFAATLVWITATSRFAEDRDAAYIRDAVSTAGELDPRWAVPWVYGSLMLGQLDEREAQEQVLRDAIEAHPGEPWFAFSLGMSRFHRGDPYGALPWLERAAAIPGAAPIYGKAARSMRKRVGGADLAPVAAPAPAVREPARRERPDPRDTGL